MKVAVIVKPNNGCCYYRCVLPVEYMPWEQNKDKFKLFFPDDMKLAQSNNLTGFVSEIPEFEPDIIFFNRDVPNKDAQWIKEQKEKGTKIVIDLDDYWELNTLHPMSKIWALGDFAKKIEDNIKIADLVLVTTEILRKKVLTINKNCIVIPNAVPFEEQYFRKEHIMLPDPNRKMRFLYACGSTHFPDVRLLANKFQRIGGDQSITNNATFVLAGFDPLPNKHCEWDKMASIFAKTKSFEILNTRPLQQHMTFYDVADVVLIPLVKNEFNQYKSELKIIEAATRELPCIVSNVLPYSELKDYPGIMWENWIENIKFCIKNPKECVTLGKQLAEKVREKYELRTWALSRYQIFKHLITN